MRAIAVIKIFAFSVFIVIGCDSGQAQQSIAPNTKIIEEQMAVVNAGRVLKTDDTTVLRFRFLLSALSAASGNAPNEVGDKITLARHALRDKFGKDVSLLDFTEAAYKARSAIQRNQFDKFLAQMVVLMGAS